MKIEGNRLGLFTRIGGGLVGLTIGMGDYASGFLREEMDERKLSEAYQVMRSGFALIMNNQTMFDDAKNEFTKFRRSYII